MKYEKFYELMARGGPEPMDEIYECAIKIIYQITGKDDNEIDVAKYSTIFWLGANSGECVGKTKMAVESLL